MDSVRELARRVILSEWGQIGSWVIGEYLESVGAERNREWQEYLDLVEDVRKAIRRAKVEVSWDD